MIKNELRKNKENSSSDKRKRIFIYSIIAVLCVVLVYILTNYILTCANVINEGYFRINDFAIISKVNVEEIESSDNIDGATEEKLDEEKIETDISNKIRLNFNVSQENEMTILVPMVDNAEIASVYLTNIKTQGTDREIYIRGADGLDVPVSSIKKDVNVHLETIDNQYVIKFSLLNKNIIENASVPENVSSIIYDATILKTLGYDLSKLKYSFKAKLNIEAKNGKVSVSNISLNLPAGNLGENGIVIQREDTEKYNLKLKNKILEIFE